jgi:hypothetical protein
LGQPRQLALYLMQQRAREAGEQFKKVNEAVAATSKAFNVAAISAAGMAAVANPTAFETFTDSLKMVVMELGIHFLPVLVKGAYHAQQFARWLSELSPGTQNFLTNAATAGASLYLLSQGASLLNSILLGIPGKLTAKVGAEVAGSLAPHVVPMLPAIGGVTSAFAVLAGSALLLRHGLIEAAEAQERLTREMFKPAAEKFTREELEKSEPYKNLAGIQDPAARQAEAAKMLAEAQKEEKEALAAQLKAGRMGPEGAGASIRASLASDKASLVQAAVQELVHGIPFVPQKQGADAFLPKEAKQANEISRLLVHFPKEMQPQFLAVEQARKTFQMGALKDPLEQKMIELNRRAAEKFIRWVDIMLGRLNAGESIGFP